MRLRDPEVPPASTIARYVLEAVGRFADEIEEKACFSPFQRGFRVRRPPDHRGHDGSEASSHRPPNLYPERSTRSAVLTAVVDRSGRGGTPKGKTPFEGAGAGEPGHGVHGPWAVSAEIVPAGSLGAAQTQESV